MSISSIGSAISSRISSVTSGSSCSTSSCSDSDSSSSVTNKVDISGPGQLMSKLKDLEKTDPAKAKDVLKSLADTVRDQAKQASGDDATHLNALADKLDQAAESGDLSPLEPKRAGGHHGGAHGTHGAHGAPPPPPPSDADKTQSTDSDDDSTNSTGSDSSTTSVDDASKSYATAAYEKQAHGTDFDKVKQLFEVLNDKLDELTKNTSSTTQAA